jgi:molybdenum cofactor biosynthesis enzyme MoaA
MNNSYRLFGRDIQIKQIGCMDGPIPGYPIPPCVNLFVKVTNRCNAQCPFCSNACHAHDEVEFNINKLFECVDEILKQHIILNRLNITGGEPSIVPDVVNDIVNRLNSDLKYQTIHLHLNTNGLLPESQQMMRECRFDSISISMHHYDLKLLSQIYHHKIDPDALSFYGINMDKVNLSCNLIKGYIDSPQEAHKMLNKAIDLNIMRIGFVGLMPVNEFSKKHFVNLEDICIDTIPRVYFIKSKNRGKNCKCSNYLYNRDGKILEIYMRNYMNPDYCESSLVYDGEFLRQGFHGNNIIY